MMHRLKLHSLAYPVTALGPGQRVVLWVSGCSLNCKHCISPELRDKNAGQWIETQRLYQHLCKLPEDLNGISLSGGEPFEQALALAKLLELLQAARPQWNVLAFSGYPLKHLKQQENARQLLAYVDILVDGPYAYQQPGNHPLAASSNQQLHYLTPRGLTLRAACEKLPLNAANLGVGNSPQQRLIGILDPATRERLLRVWQLKPV